MLWPGPPGPQPGGFGQYRLRQCTFFAHVSPDTVNPALLRPHGDGWREVEPVYDLEGNARASTWRDRDGDVFLPFDPGEVMREFWSEGYRRAGHPPLARMARAAALRGYYLMRPAFPRGLQLRVRRSFSRVQRRSAFPRWPVEESLHDLYQWLFGVLAEVAEQPVPYLGPWPRSRSWALVLTHDVETAAGCDDIDLLRVPEREFGYRSSWNFVPLRYRVADETLAGLRREGCEIGVHGLRHDGRDLGSRRLMDSRLPAIREYAGRWGAAGFRSPATQRRWEWMPRLGFEYDSSYSDTDPYEPQPGGCCTFLPYFNEDLVELPITLPQDHTLFRVLPDTDPDLWLRKARLLRERNGMALVLTHPDYASDGRLADGYRRLLREFHDDDTVWPALPREVAAWWRQRAASSIRWRDGSWVIEGPAAASGCLRFANRDPQRNAW